MQWSVKRETAPKDGQTRIRHVFAWTPAKVGDVMVWLESYAIYERFFRPPSGAPGWWSEDSRETLDYYC